MNKMNSTLGSIALTTAFVLMPFAASAATVNASSSTGVIISPNGIVRVIGADVTAVGNGFVSAATTIGNTVLSWIVNISAGTKISGNGTVNASTTGITVGDKVSFKGTLTSTSSPFTVSATNVRDNTNFSVNIPGLHKGDRDEATSTDSDNDGDHGKSGDHTVNANAEAHANANASFKDGHDGKGKGLNLFGGLHLGLGKDD